MFSKVAKYCNALSVDVALGSVIMTFFFANMFSASLPILFYLLMAIFIWCVYTLDHLIDAKDVQNEAGTFRHRFHQKYFKIIFPFWYVVFGAAFVLSFIFLPQKLLLGGMVIAVLVFVHLLLIRLFRKDQVYFIPKELMVSLIYFAGVLFAPLLYKNELVTLSRLTILVQFFIVVLLNLFIFSLFDRGVDESEGHRSLTVSKGKHYVIRMIQGLLLINVVLFVMNVFLLPVYLWKYQLLVVLMSFSLGLIYKYFNFFAINDRFRLLGDFVFIYPLIMLAW